MKTTFANGLWRTIVFLTVVISCLACEGCEEPLLKAKMELRVVSVSEDAAIVVAAVILTTRNFSLLAL